MNTHTAPSEAAATILNQIARASADLQHAIGQARADLTDYEDCSGRVNVYPPRLTEVIALGARIDALLDAITPLEVSDDLIVTARRAPERPSERPWFRAAR